MLHIKSLNNLHTWNSMHRPDPLMNTAALLLNLTPLKAGKHQQPSSIRLNQFTIKVNLVCMPAVSVLQTESLKVLVTTDSFTT